MERYLLDELEPKDLLIFIQELNEYILLNPEKRINHMQTLFHMIESDYTIISRASMTCITDVFNSIVPL
jgi:hypothetical protein